MSEVITSPANWKQLLGSSALRGKSIGFVPTMGALHEGHLELMRRAKQENDIVVVSVFLNPTQFNNPEDYDKYPRDLDEDTQKMDTVGVGYIFAPEKEMIYHDDYRYQLSEKTLSSTMEGTQRPGHFEGVLTVVLKLFNIIQPTRAYFGEKDYQQLELIRGMVDALFLDVDVVPVSTVRESHGLAMSSRNERLSVENRQKAGVFHEQLVLRESPETIKAQLLQSGFEVEYIEDNQDRRYGAVVLENVRLIDNVPL